MSTRVVHVDIHGQKYAIRSELDPQYIGEIAGYLDEKMQLAARELASNDPLRVAIIAALNIVDELHRARTDSRGAEGRLLARAADIERIVDAVLADAAKQVVNG
jgi:cell division protein ZapA (FtsZ GTPase activity inhibitor)